MLKRKVTTLRRLLSISLVLLLYCCSIFTFAGDFDRFNDEFERLKHKTQINHAPLGRKAKSHKSLNGTKFPFVIDVPKNYDKNKTYPVHVFLHGLINRSKPKTRSYIDPYLKRLMIPGTISVFPKGWGDERWWQDSQIDNISTILDNLKNTYNIDTNRIYLHGVSDGGHGVYYIASHAPTDYAAFLPLIASPFVANQHSGASTPLFLTNLINKPLYIVNTSNDHLYPAEKYSEFANSLQKNNNQTEFYVIENGQHNLKWLKDKESSRLSFLKKTVRDPYPDNIYWEVDHQLNFPRYHWLIIKDVVELDEEKFVHIRKKGNSVLVNSKNIKEFKLLISPEDFNVAENIVIHINGEEVINEKLDMKVSILQKWYKEDLDVNQLYGAELIFKKDERWSYILKE